MLLCFLLTLGAPVFAQAPEEAPNPTLQMSKAITAGFAMAIASAFCGLAQGKAISAVCEGLARNPGAAPHLRFAMIVGLALIESLAIYTLLIIFAVVNTA
jgi:F-type H+-transporting ATPase subunit c